MSYLPRLFLIFWPAVTLLTVVFLAHMYYMWCVCFGQLYLSNWKVRWESFRIKCFSSLTSTSASACSVFFFFLIYIGSTIFSYPNITRRSSDKLAVHCTVIKYRTYLPTYILWNFFSRTDSFIFFKIACLLNCAYWFMYLYIILYSVKN